MILIENQLEKKITQKRKLKEWLECPPDLIEDPFLGGCNAMYAFKIHNSFQNREKYELAAHDYL